MSDEDLAAGGAGDDAAASVAEPETTEDATAKPEAEKAEGETAKEPKPEGEGEAKAEGEPEGGKPKEEPKPKRSAQERIDQAIGRQREAERARKTAEERAARLAERLKSYETPPPRESDFASYDEFQAAQTAYHVRQANKPERQQDIEDAQAQAKEAGDVAKEAMLEAHRERVASFAEKAPDYFEKTGDDSLPISPLMAEQIYHSDQGPEVAYYLANNRTEASRLFRLTDPADVAREIGRIEGRLTTPTPKRVTSAPEPVKAVATGAGSQADFNPAKASVDDIEARLRKRGVI